jgi:hypothetical protein
MLSLQARKGRYGLHDRVHRTASVTRIACSTLISRLGYFSSVLNTASCIYLGGQRPIPDLHSSNGHTTSLTLTPWQSVRFSLFSSSKKNYYLFIFNTVVPPFRGERRSDSRCAFLQLPSIDEARAALRKLDGRMGPGGETLQVTLSRLPALPLAQLWRSMDVEEEEEEVWAGPLGFATGDEVGDVAGLDKRLQIGTRGGRRRPRKEEDDQ